MKTVIKKQKLQIPLIMGIINLTPDSFSDGGKFNTLEKAKKRVKQLEKEGADIIDIGGESSGPNSKKISEKEELKRVIPILKEIRKITKLPISIDTYKSKVAKEALENGADMINDVTSLRGDKKMAAVIAKFSCPVIMMYSKDSSARTTIKNKKYKNVIDEIINFFEKRLTYAKKHGINQKNIIIDPGMGHFISSNPRYSYEVIANLNKLKKFKRPILLGISRKSFLGGTIESRLKSGITASAIAHLNGATILRTHDVKETKEFFKSF